MILFNKGVVMTKLKITKNWLIDIKQVGLGAAFYNVGGHFHQRVLDNKLDEGEANQCLTKAYKWYMRAARAGCISAQSEVGGFLRQGWGVVEINYSEAVYWFNKAANSGCAFAMTQLSYLYMTGQGVEANDEISAQLAKQAADLKYGPGYLTIGERYEWGRGVQISFETAKMYYELARDNQPGYPRLKITKEHQPVIPWHYSKGVRQKLDRVNYNIDIGQKNGWSDQEVLIAMLEYLRREDEKAEQEQQKKDQLVDIKSAQNLSAGKAMDVETFKNQKLSEESEESELENSNTEAIVLH